MNKIELLFCKLTILTVTTASMEQITMNNICDMVPSYSKFSDLTLISNTGKEYKSSKYMILMSDCAPLQYEILKVDPKFESDVVKVDFSDTILSMLLDYIVSRDIEYHIVAASVSEMLQFCKKYDWDRFLLGNLPKHTCREFDPHYKELLDVCTYILFEHCDLSDHMEKLLCTVSLKGVTPSIFEFNTCELSNKILLRYLNENDSVYRDAALLHYLTNTSIDNWLPNISELILRFVNDKEVLDKCIIMYRRVKFIKN